MLGHIKTEAINRRRNELRFWNSPKFLDHSSSISWYLNNGTRNSNFILDIQNVYNIHIVVQLEYLIPHPQRVLLRMALLFVCQLYQVFYCMIIQTVILIIKGVGLTLMIAITVLNYSHEHLIKWFCQQFRSIKGAIRVVRL